jgi:hypothetical protein
LEFKSLLSVLMAQIGVPKLPRHAQGTAKGQSRPDDRHRSAHRILRHAAPAHFHRSRVGETHEVLRRSFSSLRRMVLQRVKRGIEAKIKPMRSYAQTISPGRLGRHQQYGQDDL